MTRRKKRQIRISKQKQRITKRKEDDIEFKKGRAKEKEKDRTLKRKADEDVFKEKEAKRRKSQRIAKRNEDEIEFKKGIAKEKKKGRNIKREKNEIEFKKGIAKEKEKQRNVKRKENEVHFKKGRAKEKATQRKIKSSSELGRRQMFFDAIRDGPIYGCVCCYRMKYKDQVVVYSLKLRSKIDEKNPNIIEYAIGVPDCKLFVRNNFYICVGCKKTLLKGRRPAMSHLNNLDLVDIEDLEPLHLTELENQMIAKNIIF